MLPSLAPQISEWLLEGAAARIVGRTAFNPRSSRSHAVAWNNNLLGSKLIAPRWHLPFHAIAPAPKVATIHVRWQPDATTAKGGA